MGGGGGIRGDASAIGGGAATVPTVPRVPPRVPRVPGCSDGREAAGARPLATSSSAAATAARRDRASKLPPPPGALGPPVLAVTTPTQPSRELEGVEPRASAARATIPARRPIWDGFSTPGKSSRVDGAVDPLGGGSRASQEPAHRGDDLVLLRPVGLRASKLGEEGRVPLLRRLLRPRDVRPAVLLGRLADDVCVPRAWPGRVRAARGPWRGRRGCSVRHRRARLSSRPPRRARGHLRVELRPRALLGILRCFSPLLRRGRSPRDDGAFFFGNLGTGAFIGIPGMRSGSSNTGRPAAGADAYTFDRCFGAMPASRRPIQTVETPMSFGPPDRWTTPRASPSSNTRDPDSFARAAHTARRIDRDAAS